MAQAECSICKDYRDGTDHHRWYTPTPDQRRDAYFAGGKISHGYCPPCALKQMIKDGFRPEEIEAILKKVEATSVKPI